MNFLDNTPCGKDLFEGQSQERIATSIADQLQKKEKCQFIGIEGDWGAGKSNLVKIVEEKLQSDQYIFFIYDVWAHQQDLQRRSILEELIFFLSEKKALSQKDKWKNKLNELTGKTVESCVKTIPRVSPGILIAFLFIVLFPLIDPLSELLYDEYDIEKLYTFSIPVVLFFMVFLYYWMDQLSQKDGFWKSLGIPIGTFAATGLIFWSVQFFIMNTFWKYSCMIVGGLGVIYSAYNWIQLFRVNGFWKSFGMALWNMMAIYKDKEVEHSQTEFTHECNPSLRDFSEFIKGISGDIHKSQKVVMVFDNMDRLPAEKVKELWASFHGIFADSKICKDTKNIHVIIPFQRKHIQYAFKGEGNESLGNDYINKTFDIVYRVSPPILLDWKKFFKTMWKKAFESPELGFEYDRTVQIFDLLGPAKTPRNMIVFINDIVAAKMIFKEDIPLHYIALFIAMRDQILEDPITQIINKTFLAPLSFIYQNDEDLAKYMTALVYQIDPNSALGIIYSEELKYALENNEQGKVELISKTPEFLEILTHIFHGLVNIPNVALAFKIIPDEAWKGQKQNLWNDLYHKVQANHTYLDSIQDTLSDWLVAILENVSHKNKEKLSQEILACMREKKSFSSSHYFKIIEQLKQILPSVNITLREKKISPESFMELLNTAKGRYQEAHLKCDTKELDAFLANRSPISDDMRAIKYASSEIRSKLDKFRGCLSDNTFLMSHTENREQFAIIIDILENIALERIKISVDPSKRSSMFHQNGPYDSLDFSLLAMQMMNSSNSYTSSYSNLLNNSESENIELFSKVIVKYHSFEDILLNLRVIQKSLYAKTVSYLLKQEPLPKNLNLIPIFESYDEIIENGELNSDLFLRKLEGCDFPDIEDQDIESIFKGELLLSDIQKSDSLMASKIIQTISNYLDKFSQDKWEEYFRNVFEGYEIWKGVYILRTWRIIALEVMNKISTDMIHENLHIGDGSLKILRRMKDPFKYDLKPIRDLWIQKGKITPQQFYSFGEFLFKYGELEKRSESLRTILPIEIFQDSKCLDVILKQQDKVLEIIKTANPEDSKLFKNFIAESVASDPDTPLKSFFERLKLKLPLTEVEWRRALSLSPSPFIYPDKGKLFL